MKKNDIIIENEKIGIKYSIPTDWIEVKEKDFSQIGINENTLIMLLVDENTNISFIDLGELQEKSWEISYEKVINSLKELNSKILIEYETIFKEIKVKQILSTVSDETVNILHTLLVINGRLIDCTISIPQDIDTLDKLLNSKNYIILDTLISTIEKTEISSKIEPTPTEMIEKSRAQLIVEEDISYKNIALPDFYLKYTYFNNDSTTLLSIINDDIYFSGPKNLFRIIKTDKVISDKIKDIINEEINNILDENTDSNCKMCIKLDDKYALINYNKENNALFNDIIYKIISLLEGLNQEVSLFSYDIYPERLSDIPMEVLPENVSVIEYNDEYNKSNDLYETYECLHEIDKCPIFKFDIPVFMGEKKEKAFNVFDIVKDNITNLRVFIFKCAEHEYEETLNNWMLKNISATNEELKGYEENTLNDGTHTKEFLLANDKYYAVIYKDRFMIAISSIGTMENLNIVNNILNSMELIPVDYNLKESIERKLRSIELLKYQNIPYIEELPILKSTNEIESNKTMEDIATRALCLLIISNYAIDILNVKKKRNLLKSKKEFNKLIDKYSLRSYLTTKERDFMRKANSKDATLFAWQIEGAKTLFWILGLIDDLDYPNMPANIDTFIGILIQCNTIRSFVSKCYLRDLDTVLDMADLTYRYDWYCVDCKVNGIDCKIDKDIVLERHRAFSWVLTMDTWDNVDLST